MTDLSDLIARVERATGADRDLGRDVLLACGWSKTLYGYFRGPLHMWRSPDGTSFDDDDFRQHDPTISTDAALALVNHALSGAWWIVTKGRVRDGEPLYGAQLFREGHNPFTSLPLAEAEHEIMPLAIILALLRDLDQAERDKSR